MSKKIRLNKESVTKIVRERLRRGGNVINETKIDRAIKKYLSERTEEVEGPQEEDIMSFGDDTKEAFRDMLHGLTEITEDLKVIQTREPDVLVEIDPEEQYSELYLEQLIEAMEWVIEGLEFLRDLDGEFEE